MTHWSTRLLAAHLGLSNLRGTSAQDPHAELRRQGAGVGVATVYRHLQSLANAGAADMLRTAAGGSGCRICGTAAHHHRVCRVCGRTVEIEGREVERWTRRVAEAAGLVEIDHTVEERQPGGGVGVAARHEHPAGAQSRRPDVGGGDVDRENLLAAGSEPADEPVQLGPGRHRRRLRAGPARSSARSR